VGAATVSVVSAGVRFAVRLTPRAGADRIDGVRDGELLARVTAPPADGAANAVLLRLIASELDVPRSSVRLLAGATARHKLVAIDGETADRIVARWPGLRV
jgi:uncharacterized protein YggU (UPF0235/DUF167 family)